MNGVDPARLAKLSVGQRDCLRLVARHWSSKDIGRQLNVSPHTVDQRIKVAMRLLGVDSRFEAARLLTDHEQVIDTQPLVYQAPDIPVIPPPVPIWSTSDQSEAERPEMVLREIQTPYVALPLLPSSALRKLEGVRRNGFNAWYKLLTILTVAVGSALAFGAVLAGLEALSRLT
ncbi:MAG TPA: helix-turn-helix transcriptional regulator [Allosphingosinicella sp.]|jgi:DNA-binding CsgD family transcriptional regulator